MIDFASIAAVDMSGAADQKQTKRFSSTRGNAHVLLLQKVKRLHDEMADLHYFSIDEAKLFNAMTTFLRNSQLMED